MITVQTRNHNVRLSKKIIKDFWSLVIKTDICWFYRGPVTKDGYGIFRVPYKKVPLYAHRISFILKNGKIPTDKPELDHLCKNRLCCNPDHLEPVNRSENMGRTSNGPTIIGNMDEYKKTLGRYDFNLGSDSMLRNVLDWKLWRLTWFEPEKLTNFDKTLNQINKMQRTGKIDRNELVDYYLFWFGHSLPSQTLDEELWGRNKYRLNAGKQFIGIPKGQIVYARESYRDIVLIYEDEECYDRTPYVPKYVKMSLEESIKLEKNNVDCMKKSLEPSNG